MPKAPLLRTQYSTPNVMAKLMTMMTMAKPMAASFHPPPPEGVSSPYSIHGNGQADPHRVLRGRVEHAEAPDDDGAGGPGLRGEPYGQADREDRRPGRPQHRGLERPGHDLGGHVRPPGPVADGEARRRG